jgi:hypothetical protein
MSFIPKETKKANLEIPSPILHAIPSFTEISKTRDNIRFLVQPFINPSGNLVDIKIRINIDHKTKTSFEIRGWTYNFGSWIT